MRNSVARTRAKQKDSAANLGFEPKLWAYGTPLAGNANYAWVRVS